MANLRPSWGQRYSVLSVQIELHDAERIFRLTAWMAQKRDKPCSPDEAVALARYRHTCDVLRRLQDQRYQLIIEGMRYG